MSYESITSEMIQALSDEIEALRNGDGGKQIPLENGRRSSPAGGRFIYVFDLSYELAVPDDTPAQLRVGTNTYRVTVVAVDGFEITLAIEEDLGPRIPTASLNTSPWYLLEILSTRLEETMTGKLKVNREMALRLFNQLPNEPIRPSPVPDFRAGPSASGSPPNDEQKMAVMKALSQRITFVWGPPGTGKTTTINYLVPILIRAGERIFITSHTNTAVDAVLRAAKNGLTQEELRNGAIIRIGQVREKDKEIEYITLEAVVKRLGAELSKKLEELQARIQVLKKSLSEWTTWETDLIRIQELETARNQADKRLKDALRVRQDTEKQIASLTEREGNLRVRLVEAQNSGFFRRLFAGLNPEQIARQLKFTENERLRCQHDLERITKELPELEAATEAAHKAFTQAVQALQHRGPLPTLDEVRSKIRGLTLELEAVEKEAEATQAKLQQLAWKVISEAKVIGATLTKMATTQEIYQNKYDTVIVDEASMAMQPHLWFAAGLATKRVVVLGDFLQLQPICSTASVTARRRLAKSIYKEAGIISDDNEARVRLEDPRLARLTKQHRMHETIGELVNHLVYRESGNALEHLAPECQTKPGRLAYPEPEHPIVLCDTTLANPWCARLEPGYSRYNIYSAITAIRLAQQVVERTNGLEVGVICPYTAQARLLNRLVRSHNLTDRVKVATVHSFQGNEKDVIIVDLVDGPPFDRPGMLLTKEEAKNLLNVAFSRAKGKVVLVGHVGYFSTHTRGEALARTWEYFRKHAKTIDSTTILSGYDDPEVIRSAETMTGPMPLGTPKGMSLFHESTFYQAFNRDLLSARERVIIFSPFIQPGRTSRLEPVIRRLLDKGIEVIVVTRPRRKSARTSRRLEDTESDAVVDELSRLGVTVLTRPNLHEKLAFIDDKVTWMGSLNILSHSHTTEQMVRFDNTELTHMILEFSGVQFLFRKEEQEAKKAKRLEQIGALLAKLMDTPNCPKCGRRMVLRIGQYGVFFGCPSYPADKTTVPVPRSTLELIIHEMSLPCPSCGIGTMRLRSSARGVFLGCSEYPGCRATEPLG